MWCGDPDGLCAFSRKQSDAWGEGLPVAMVDEEVFRLAPSLVIGTVDKFAQLPLRGQTGLLFGRTSSWCERHGYRHPDLTRKTDCKDGVTPGEGTGRAPNRTVVGRCGHRIWLSRMSCI